MDIIEGPKLWLIVLSLCIGLLLSSLESTIVSTALLSISADFDNGNDDGHAHSDSDWVVIAYLLTYSSFLVIFARLSDVTGRKSALATSLCIFTVASLACGLARSLRQLVVFRAFQGVGGSGVYALAMVLVAEITPKKYFGGISAMVNSVFVIASAVGPVIGGAITTYSTWRWCFLLNVPAGALVISLISFIFPKMETQANNDFRRSLMRVDWLGLVLCLAASIIIIVPLQEGGVDLAWDSIPVIAMVTTGGLCWGAFALWQAWLARRRGNGELMPLIPHHVVTHRVLGACILTAFLTGLLFTSTVVYLPQRFQTVNALSPVQAGINILPVLLISALGATVSGLVLSKKNICSYLVLVGNSLQLIGIGLQSSLPTTDTIPATSYGFQAILGLGLGTSLSSSFILARIEVPRAVIAATVGAMTQLRVFGGVIGVVISRATLSSYQAYHHLPQNATSSSSSSSSSPSNPLLLSSAVREEYGAAFNWQARVLTYIAAANIVIAVFTFRRSPKPIRDRDPSPDPSPDPAAAGEQEDIGGASSSIVLDTIDRQREGERERVVT